MNTDNLNRWLTLCANIGVVIGIMFLALELQQNNKLLKSQAQETQALSIQTATTLDQDFLLVIAADSALAETWHTYLRTPDTLTEVERLQASFLMGSLLRRLEGVYLQERLGSISEEGWNSRQPLFIGIANSPGYSAYLETDTSRFIGEELRVYMHQLLTDVTDE
jgi:hypothetical protein